nr:MAG TPA: hypothetical protein [Caudoviricetes sp.]
MPYLSYIILSKKSMSHNSLYNVAFSDFFCAIIHI